MCVHLGEVQKTAIFENKVPWTMKGGKIGAVVISRLMKTDDVPVPLKVHVVIRMETVPVGVTKEVHKSLE